jgi:hypothetical protein
MCRWMVDLATWMLSFISSPRMRSAPHVRLAAAISRMRATVSGAMGGWCAGEVVRDLRRQKRVKSRRCLSWLPNASLLKQRLGAAV